MESLNHSKFLKYKGTAMTRVRFDETDRRETGLGLLRLPAPRHQAMARSQHGREKGKDGKSNVQNLKDKYNIYN